MKITAGLYDLREVTAINSTRFLQTVDHRRKSQERQALLQSFTRLMFR